MSLRRQRVRPAIRTGRGSSPVAAHRQTVRGLIDRYIATPAALSIAGVIVGASGCFGVGVMVLGVGNLIRCDGGVLITQ